ncbi:MAG TPA: hypothetical protein VEW71_03900 [Allosphingosinicella sp.]|nr:hypothetical protein [Allosphingosinicella sp.]
MSKPEPEAEPSLPAGERAVFGDAGSPGCLAFGAAPVAAAGGVTVAFGSPAFAAFEFVGALIVASFHVAVLALPIYFALANRYRINFLIVLVASALIGALPATIIAILSGAWRDLPNIAATFGFSGVCGGLVFWLVLKLDPR